MGIKGSSTATLILEDVVIPAENVLGEVGKGHHVALNILNFARLKACFWKYWNSKTSNWIVSSIWKRAKTVPNGISRFYDDSRENCEYDHCYIWSRKCSLSYSRCN